MRVVLDAWAIIAVARGEPAAAAVSSEIERDRAGASWINLGEAYYVVARESGRAAAAAVIAEARADLVCEAPSPDRVLAAAGVKTEHRLSYADAFAVATAEAHRAPLMTGDPEILALERGRLEIIDLRG